MQLVKSLLSNDIIERAVKTFVQAFVAVLAVTPEPVSKSAVIAATAAGVSAVWNFLKTRV